MKEIERDLHEMGHLVTTKSMQDKKGDFTTKELVPYSFMLIDGDGWTGVFEALGYSEEEAARARAYVIREANDRMVANITGKGGLNPGNSWEHRKDIWAKFLELDGKFSYTYPERIHQPRQIERIDELASKDRMSRHLIINIYEPSLDDYRRGGVRRVPCTMHYQVLFRDDIVYLIQVMRSLDLYTHLPIDMSIGWLMAKHLSTRYKITCQTRFVMQIASLHAYKTDLDKRGIF